MEGYAELDFGLYPVFTRSRYGGGFQSESVTTMRSPGNSRDLVRADQEPSLARRASSTKRGSAAATAVFHAFNVTGFRGSRYLFPMPETSTIPRFNEIPTRERVSSRWRTLPPGLTAVAISSTTKAENSDTQPKHCKRGRFRNRCKRPTWGRK